MEDLEPGLGLSVCPVMPITLRAPIRPLSQAEFGKLAYSVMGCVFEIHREMGRFFDEKIYKRELAYRHPTVQLEVPIEISHGSFKRVQYIDVLVDRGAAFEFKSVDALTPRHQAQLLNYMLLAEIGHGKLVNVGKESVEHEFVNTILTWKHRVQFAVDNSHWSDKAPGAEQFQELLTSLLRDWGAGLDSRLYEEALTHLLGGEAQVVCDAEVLTLKHSLGWQKLRMAASGVAFALTAFPQPDPLFERHITKLLRNTRLEAILWANIDLKTVTFTTLR